MNIFKKFIMMLKRINGWYIGLMPRSNTFLVHPVIVFITMFGLATTAWGLGTGIGAEKLGNELSQDLRNSPQRIEILIEDLYKNNRISGTQREIELQKLQVMTPILLGAADAIQDKGQDIGFQAAAQALFETMMNFGLGGKAGSLVGASSTGQGLDQLYSIKNIIESVEGSQSLSWTPFSAEEALLTLNIQDVMAIDADALFIARMRTKINVLRGDYIGLLKENPCEKEKILADFRAELIGLGWGAGTDVYGEGEKFSSHVAFIDWLIAEATIDVDIPCEENVDEDKPVGEEEQTQPVEDIEIADCVAALDMYEITYPVYNTWETGCKSTYTVSNLSDVLLDFKSYYLVEPTDNSNLSGWYTHTVGPGDIFDITDSYIWDLDTSAESAQHTVVIVYRATSACRALITDENEEDWARFLIELDSPCGF